MTGDPFLLAHETLPHFFNLAGRLSPISIRDQMVRGQMLVDRAIDERRISAAPNDLRPLLVVGAGAAGSTVAIHAADRGVPTAIVDRHAVPFRRAECHDILHFCARVLALLADPDRRLRCAWLLCRQG